MCIFAYPVITMNKQCKRYIVGLLLLVAFWGAENERVMEGLTGLFLQISPFTDDTMNTHTHTYTYSFN